MEVSGNCTETFATPLYYGQLAGPKIVPVGEISDTAANSVEPGEYIPCPAGIIWEIRLGQSAPVCLSYACMETYAAQGCALLAHSEEKIFP